ncbi:pilus assembly protein TadG-related protein [Arthrobacter sp. SO3]|uniref:pilus assembly protein TadG-related protein n=1 Tax=Arthrobacter sp. SO3 TaxID=1897057 RepID=UPI001CFFF799|nr:TadE/TadG family type IV pilus assembly protein [Arthrobacter sp. SO3]
MDNNENERGVIAPLAAILMVALLGFGALAVDVGAMYSEKTQLQNGADAAALGVAQACAKTPCAVDQKVKAAPLANGNALDGSSNVVSATVNAGTVDVTTETPAGAGGEHFSLYLARVLGINSVEIQASAQAKFGGISAGNVLPLSFSKCESDPSFSKDLQFFPEHGNTLASKPDYECVTSSSSGLEVPGGFGWLDHPAGVCNVTVDIKNPWVGTNTGQNYDSDCATVLNQWGAVLADPTKTVDILVPIFDNVRGTGAGAEFHIEAFAQISLRGWNLKGGSTLPGDFMTAEATTLSKSLKLKNSDNGIFGRFIKKVSLAEAATLGGPTTYGSLGVTLSK